MNIRYENWSGVFDFYGWQEELELRGGVTTFHQMVVWINENIDNAMNNVMWTYSNNPVFRFRKSKDQAWFMLRWV